MNSIKQIVRKNKSAKTNKGGDKVNDNEKVNEMLQHFNLDASVLDNYYIGYSDQMKNIGIAITSRIKGKGRVTIYFDPDCPLYLIRYEKI